MEARNIPWTRVQLDIEEIKQFCEEQGVPNDAKACGFGNAQSRARESVTLPLPELERRLRAELLTKLSDRYPAEPLPFPFLIIKDLLRGPIWGFGDLRGFGECEFQVVKQSEHLCMVEENEGEKDG